MVWTLTWSQRRASRSKWTSSNGLLQVQIEGYAERPSVPGRRRDREGRPIPAGPVLGDDDLDRRRRQYAPRRGEVDVERELASDRLARDRRLEQPAAALERVGIDDAGLMVRRIALDRGGELMLSGAGLGWRGGDDPLNVAGQPLGELSLELFALLPGPDLLALQDLEVLDQALPE